MQGLRYTSRGLRRRNNTDKWEVTLSHVDPVTGETVRTFHTVDAKTKKGAKVADFLGQRKQDFERDLLSIEVALQP